MIFRCKDAFETREDGRRTYIDKDTVWMAENSLSAAGGYELALIREIDTGTGDMTGMQARIRLDRLSTNFTKVPMDDIFTPTRYSEFLYIK